MNKKQIINLIILPIQFFLIFLLNKLELEGNLNTILLFIISTISFIIVLKANKKDLETDWFEFKDRIFKKIFIGIIIAIVALLIINVTRSLLPDKLLSMEGAGGEENIPFELNPLPMLLGSIIPLYAAFMEEVIFRKTLIDLGNNKKSKYFWLLVQSILFGLIHINNFGGNVYRTIPYMFVGLFFGSIYLRTENICWSILGHLIFNGTLSLLPTIFLLIVS